MKPGKSWPKILSEHKNMIKQRHYNSGIFTHISVWSNRKLYISEIIVLQNLFLLKIIPLMNEEEQENVILIQCRKKRQNIEQINMPGVPPRPVWLNAAPCWGVIIAGQGPLFGSQQLFVHSQLWREPGDQGRVCCCVASGQWAGVDNWVQEEKKRNPASPFMIYNVPDP